MSKIVILFAAPTRKRFLDIQCNVARERALIKVPNSITDQVKACLHG